MIEKWCAFLGLFVNFNFFPRNVMFWCFCLIRKESRHYFPEICTRKRLWFTFDSDPNRSIWRTMWSTLHVEDNSVFSLFFLDRRTLFNHVNLIASFPLTEKGQGGYWTTHGIVNSSTLLLSLIICQKWWFYHTTFVKPLEGSFGFKLIYSDIGSVN